MKRIRPGFSQQQQRKAAPNWRRLADAVPNVRPRPRVDAFRLPDPPPRGVLPDNNRGMAQDTALVGSTAWASAIIASSYSEGLQFLGYPYLAELAQRPEYRVISSTIAEEMTRKWGKFEAVGDDDKTDAIKQLEDMFKALNVRDNLKKTVEDDGYFGRSHLYLDTGDTDDRDELRTSIGSGSDPLSLAKVNPRKPLKRIKPVEAVWCYPTNYESADPLKPSWYNPEHWFVMGKELHVSRLLTFVGREVPDLLKPAYSFGGLSLSQIAKPYVDNWLQTRQSVNDLIQAFVVWGLKTNLSESLTMQGDQLFARLDLFNRLRNNRGIMALDKDTEEFFNVTATLSGLEALQAQSQEHMASVSRIPLVKLLGIQPTGLNASSEGEIRVFYDTIHGYQESFLTKPLIKLMHFCMLSLWGAVDPQITWSWHPLWALDEKQKAEMQEVKARTAQIWIDTGVIDKQEERARIADDADTPYPGLDPNAEPDLKQEEEEGLIPRGSGGGVRAVLEEGEPDKADLSDEDSSEEEEEDDLKRERGAQREAA